MQNRIVLYLLLLIVFVLVAYWGVGGLDSVKELVAGAKEYAPDIKTGLDELGAAEQILPPAIRDQAKKLEDGLLAMVAEGSRSNCFQDIGGFRENLGKDEEDTVTFLFTFDPNAEGTWVDINTYKSVTYNRFFVPKMKPCVIAKGDLPKKFVQKFIDNDKNIDLSLEIVSGVNIYYNTKKLNGNVLRVIQEGWPITAVNDESDNYQSDGILYKGSDNEICFIPTNKVYNYDQDGIDNDYVNDKADEGTIAWKVATGVLPSCTSVNGYEAIELFADDDASAGEFDCEIKFKKDSQKQLLKPIPNFGTTSGQDGDCSDIFKDHLLKEGVLTLPKDGCWAIISEDDDSDYNDCGWVEVGPGEIIPGKNKKGTKLYQQSAPRYENTDPLCLLEFYNWRMPDELQGELLCDGSSHKWYQCEDTTTGMEKKMTVNGKDVVYTCNGGGVWFVNNTEHLPWFTYGSIELFTDNDNSYPGSCDTQDANIYFACDARGTMGVVKETDFGSGTFNCPTEDYDCNNYAKSHSGKVANSCNLFLSEDDNSGNDCADASVPFGEWVNMYAGTFYHCDGNEKNCEKGPSYVGKDSDDHGLCLLRNKWIVERYPGDLLCSNVANQNWILCDNRKVGSYVVLNGETQYCQNNDGDYRFMKK